MTTPDEYRALADRVETGEGADLELDALIRCAVFATKDAFVEQSKINGAWCIYEPGFNGKIWAWEPRGLSLAVRMGSFTESLDAALSLCSDESASEILNEAMEALSVAGWRKGQYVQTLTRFVVAVCLRARAERGK